MNADGGERPAVGSGWSAVVVNYNAGSHLEPCVRSVLDDGACAVVVVDNASSDGSLQALPEDARVGVVQVGRNSGYACAANLGIAATDTPIVAVLNPDTRILPGTGAAMETRLTSPDVGAVGPRITNPDGTTYPSARRVPSTLDAAGHGLLGMVWPGNPFSVRYRQLDADPDLPRDVDWVSGAALWLRREAVDQIGGWDERYFMYVEDVDLCWRLRNAGWRVVYDPGGTVEHVQGTATAKRPYRMLVEHHRSLFRFAAKRWRGLRRVLLIPAGAYLAVRAIVTMAHHALARRSGRPRSSE